MEAGYGLKVEAGDLGKGSVVDADVSAGGGARVGESGEGEVMEGGEGVESEV